MHYFKVCHPRCVCNSLGGGRVVNATQLINYAYIYTNSLCTRPIFVHEISSPLTSMVVRIAILYVFL